MWDHLETTCWVTDVVPYQLVRQIFSINSRHLKGRWSSCRSTTTHRSHKPEARRGTIAKTRASNSPQFCIPPFPDGSDPKQIGSDPIGRSVLLSLETWMLQTGLGYGTAFSLGTIGLRECGTFDHLQKLANIKCYMIPNVWDVPPTVLVFTWDRKLENTMMIDLFRS